MRYWHCLQPKCPMNSLTIARLSETPYALLDSQKVANGVSARVAGKKHLRRRGVVIGKQGSLCRGEPFFRTPPPPHHDYQDKRRLKIWNDGMMAHFGFQKLKAGFLPLLAGFWSNRMQRASWWCTLLFPWFLSVSYLYAALFWKNLCRATSNLWQSLFECDQPEGTRFGWLEWFEKVCRRQGNMSGGGPLQRHFKDMTLLWGTENSPYAKKLSRKGYQDIGRWR